MTFHKRYAAYDPIWELWNEPNLAAYWGAPPDRDAYATLAIATATALRNAGAREILSGGTSGVDVSWLYDLSVRGVFEVVTGCAVHSYEQPSQALNRYLQATSVIPPGIPKSTPPKRASSRRAVSRRSSRRCGTCTATWVCRLWSWCEFRDGTAGPRPPYTDPMGLVEPDYSPKKVFLTIQSLVTGG